MPGRQLFVAAFFDPTRGCVEVGGQVLVDGVGPVGIPIDVVGDWGAKEQAISQALGAFAVRLPATPSARGRTVQISLAMVRETFVVL